MKKILTFLTLLLYVISCDSNQFLPINPIQVNAGEEEGMIVLGDKLDDPYSVDNMSAALASLYGHTKAGRIPLSPTNYYVRFLPLNEVQYDYLVDDLGVDLIDHPVDYEIVKEGDWYHDPLIPKEKFTWQYAVVDISFSFPDWIEYEILEECYIKENDSSTKADDIDWDAVERESFKLTGNAHLLSSLTKAGEGVPQGRISIEDDKTGQIYGVKGVMVCCNVFVKIANAYTDEDGNYKMSRSFSSSLRYRLHFKNSYGFAQGLNKILIPASLSGLGKHSADGLDYHIDKNSSRTLFNRCVVNNAAYDYYKDCDERGIPKPMANLRIWQFKGLNTSSTLMLQQGVLVDDSILNKYIGQYMSLVKMFLPDVVLGLKDNADFASIYCETIHQMAHASHYMQVRKDYWNSYLRHIMTSFVTSGFALYGTGTEEGASYCELAEMLAYYVETMWYREKYSDDTALFGTSYWFRPQILVSLDERGLVRQKIMAAFTSDITDTQMLQKKLVSLYPEMKITINQIFGRYD